MIGFSQEHVPWEITEMFTYGVFSVLPLFKSTWFLRFNDVTTSKLSSFFFLAALIPQCFYLFPHWWKLVSFYLFRSYRQCRILVCVCWDMCLGFSPGCVFNHRTAGRALICISLLRSQAECISKTVTCRTVTLRPDTQRDCPCPTWGCEVGPWQIFFSYSKSIWLFPNSLDFQHIRNLCMWRTDMILYF